MNKFAAILPSHETLVLSLPAKAIIQCQEVSKLKEDLFTKERESRPIHITFILFLCLICMRENVSLDWLLIFSPSSIYRILTSLSKSKCLFFIILFQQLHFAFKCMHFLLAFVGIILMIYLGGAFFFFYKSYREQILQNISRQSNSNTSLVRTNT